MGARLFLAWATAGFLFYLVPLIYFRFVDPHARSLGAAASQGGRP